MDLTSWTLTTAQAEVLAKQILEEYLWALTVKNVLQPNKWSDADVISVIVSSSFNTYSCSEWTLHLRHNTFVSHHESFIILHFFHFTFIILSRRRKGFCPTCECRLFHFKAIIVSSYLRRKVANCAKLNNRNLHF